MQLPPLPVPGSAISLTRSPGHHRNEWTAHTLQAKTSQKQGELHRVSTATETKRNSKEMTVSVHTKIWNYCIELRRIVLLSGAPSPGERAWWLSSPLHKWKRLVWGPITLVDSGPHGSGPDPWLGKPAAMQCPKQFWG